MFVIYQSLNSIGSINYVWPSHSYHFDILHTIITIRYYYHFVLSHLLYRIDPLNY